MNTAPALRSALNRRRRRLLLAAAASGAVVSPGWMRHAQAQVAGRGKALLVGNTAYNPSEEDIAPAVKCVRELGARLKAIGFEVVVLNDAPLEAVRTELDALQKAVAADPTLAAVFYFVGHGFQSNAENFVLPAGGNLKDTPADLAKNCLSLERDVFTRLKRPRGDSATVILIDACRTPDRPRAPNEGYNQTMPPEGCHVAFATGPGKRAFAPADPDKFTLFTDSLVSELDATQPAYSVYSTLERVKAKVSRQVNANSVIVRIFGPNAQEPELASNVRGDPRWVFGLGPAITSATRKPEAAASAATSPGSAMGSVDAELDAIRALASPQEAADRLRKLLETLPSGETADLARLRLKDLDNVLKAVAQARLDPNVSSFAALQPPSVNEDVVRAIKGDKYAALRVAETLPPPAGGELIERTDYGRWLIFAAWLGNGIAAWRLSEHFKNVDRRDTEASRYLNLARTNQYTPPRQLGAGR